ncbi:pirin family protein [Undibacterium sp. Ji50W]|uniref:pirin family protein n=1 Tax=Undibacterium sp. Ji50W TaxID=3413041 RepID=UPI003BF34C29
MQTTPNLEIVHKPRPVEHLVTGELTSDGAGVQLTRVLTHEWQHRLDPFLMLDAITSNDPGDYFGGFPDHPHRGFEIATYLIAGRMRHRDSAGNEGLLESGGMQWMTAGRGVVHSEMPEQHEGRLESFQLWLNLAAKDKMLVPWYRDFKSTEIPEFVTAEGVTVRVIAGASHGVAGTIQRDITQPLYLDLHLPAGGRFAQTLSSEFNAFVFPYRGELSIGKKTVPARHMAVFGNDADCDGIVLQASEPCRALLIAGRPLHQPIVQHGPFVMNTQEEINQAVSDFRSGRLA